MKSTLAKLKNLKFKGKTRLPWAEQRINEYAEYLEEELPDLARQLEKMPFVKFHGSPHATANTNDPWHASVALRRKDDFKGSGLSLHVYPDGTVVPSKPEFPVVHLRPATKEEVGNENSCWLDPQFVANWKASNEEHEGSADKKAKRKARPSDFSGYSTHPDTGDLYRYVENGAVVYLDPNTKKEYYYNEEGQPTWL